MKPYLTILNNRTLFVIVSAVAVTYFSFLLNIDYYVDLTLLSIAIIFPLVFTIRGSFRRREKALEHLSKFRAAVKTIHYFGMSDKGLSAAHKTELTKIMQELSIKTMEHLSRHDHTISDLDQCIDQVQDFVQRNQEELSSRSKDRILRLMRDLHDAVENLHAIHTHRTPVSLKAYCLVFIYLFPLIYAPTVINSVGSNTHPGISYLIVALTQFILISLYNIQDQLEYPFDNHGLDDIKLDTFIMERS